MDVDKLYIGSINFKKVIFLEKPDANQKSSKKKKWREKILHGNKPILIAIGITGIAVIIGAIVFTKLYLSTADKFPGDGEDSRKNIPINSSIGILLQKNKLQNFILSTCFYLTLKI